MAAKTRWFIRGWELTTGGVRDVESRSGWESVASPQGANVTIPNRGGQVFRAKRPAPGSFTLSIWLAGATEAALLDLWHTMVQAASPYESTVVVRRVDPDAQEWVCDAELVGTVNPTRVGDRALRAELTFSIPSGFWRSTASTQHATAAGAAVPQSLPLTGLVGSSGQLTDLLLEVHGPITNPVITDVTAGGSGHSVTYTGTVPAGGLLKLDAATWASNGSGAGFSVNPAAITHTAGRFMLVDVPAPGVVPTLRLSGSGTGSGTRLVVTGRKSRR